MHKLKLIIALFIFLLPSVLIAQIGGKGVYDFLNLTNSARIVSLGGKNVSLFDEDLNFAHHNPALLNPEMNKKLILNYINYFAGINFGYTGFALDKEKLGTFSIGIHYINYGKFIGADETGVKTGEFRASDYAFNIIWSKEFFKNIRTGVNLKPIYSHLESYNSLGIAVDLGVTYLNPEEKFSAGLIFKNIGTQIKPYYKGHYEPLPFDIQLGVSKRLKYAPFRVNATLHHLHIWNLLYDVPQEITEISFAGEEDSEKGNKLYNFLDNTFRHTVFGIEFLPTENFYASIGYNHQRRQEMKITDKGGFVGFSWGFGIKLKKFGISYARSSYHLAGGSNHFSVYLNMSEIKRKKITNSNNNK